MKAASASSIGNFRLGETIVPCSCGRFTVFLSDHVQRGPTTDSYRRETTKGDDTTKVERNPWRRCESC